MNLAELNKVAKAMVAPGRGILAADESSGTIKKRFDAIGAECTADSRRDYREMLFRSGEAMKNFISGVILYDETIRQKAKDGTPLVKLIEAAGALPGIKVDDGTKPLPFCPGEVITEGLDGLRERLAEYVGLGAKFAKWRAVIDIGADMPSYNCIKANAHALARYAALCLEGGHRADRRARSADGRRPRHRPLRGGDRVGAEEAVFSSSTSQRSRSRGIVLKPNMVIAGKKCAKQAPAVEEVAETTVKLLKACVPAGGAGHRLPLGRPVGRGCDRASRRHEPHRRPAWKLTFSYGRALQAAPQKAWGGKTENVAAAQRAFSHRAKMNGLAAHRPVEAGPGEEGGVTSRGSEVWSMYGRAYGRELRPA